MKNFVLLFVLVSLFSNSFSQYENNELNIETKDTNLEQENMFEIKDTDSNISKVEFTQLETDGPYLIVNDALSSLKRRKKTVFLMLSSGDIMPCRIGRYGIIENTRYYIITVSFKFIFKKEGERLFIHNREEGHYLVEEIIIQ
jgi:hypothetical protein